ncbi:hypothetical protein SUGI_0219730 [Cryptomeria japonica]|nr:hypothetical protein SUGI_0219730 [Cryptomeria japonica]
MPTIRGLRKIFFLREAQWRIERLTSESPVAIFTISSCFMCYVAKRLLLLELGVNPTVYTTEKRMLNNEAGIVNAHAEEKTTKKQSTKI